MKILQLTVEVRHVDAPNCAEEYKWTIIDELLLALQKRVQELDDQLIVLPRTIHFPDDQ